MTNLGLTRCPYDGGPLEVEDGHRGALLVCNACGAAWETHGNFVGRVRDPDRRRLIAVRRARSSVQPRRSVRVRERSRRDVSRSNDALAASVVAHLPEAIEKTENANSVVVAQYVATKIDFDGRTDPVKRAELVFALANIVTAYRRRVVDLDAADRRSGG